MVALATKGKIYEGPVFSLPWFLIGTFYIFYINYTSIGV